MSHCSSPCLRPWACRWINHWSLVMHGQCDARPVVTFPAAGLHRPLTSTKLYQDVYKTSLTSFQEHISRMHFLKIPDDFYVTNDLICDCVVRSGDECECVVVRVTRSTSTDGLTSADHIEPSSVSHSDVTSAAAAVYYNAASTKPVRTVCSCGLLV